MYDDDLDYAAMYGAAHTVMADTVDESERAPGSGELPASESGFEYSQKMFYESTAFAGWPQYRVQVPVDVSGDAKPKAEKPLREFLIGKPAFRARAWWGGGHTSTLRSTTTKRFVSLMDVWRADYEDVERKGEGCSLQCLGDLAVPPRRAAHAGSLERASKCDWL